MKITDTQRIDWLEENSAVVRWESHDDGSLPFARVYGPDEEGAINHELGVGDDYRTAIDDAMDAALRHSSSSAALGREHADREGVKAK